MKKILLVAIALCVVFFCAFKVIPVVRLSFGDGGNIDVGYHNAQSDGETLTISVNYNSCGESFEIGRDIVVAADSSFNETLRIKSCVAGEDLYTYTFRGGDLGRLEKIYIQPPILYVLEEITPVSVPLAAGNVVKTDAKDTVFETAGANWFSVESVSFEEGPRSDFTVRVIVKAIAKDLPRFPKLVIGEKELGGTAALSFNENDDFSSGEFLFSVKGDSAEQVKKLLETASLVVPEALVRADVDKLMYSSNIKTLSVIVSETE